MVQELRMDGELNNYSKYLVYVCVCVCVQSFQQDLQHITWCSLQVCPPQQMQELSVLFFVLCTTCMFPFSLLSCWCLLVSVDLCLEGQLQETESLSPVQQQLVCEGGALSSILQQRPENFPAFLGKAFS